MLQANRGESGASANRELHASGGGLKNPDFLALLSSHATRDSRSPRFRLCSPEIRKKSTPVLQATIKHETLEVGETIIDQECCPKSWTLIPAWASCNKWQSGLPLKIYFHAGWSNSTNTESNLVQASSVIIAGRQRVYRFWSRILSYLVENIGKHDVVL